MKYDYLYLYNLRRKMFPPPEYPGASSWHRNLVGAYCFAAVFIFMSAFIRPFPWSHEYSHGGNPSWLEVSPNIDFSDAIDRSLFFAIPFVALWLIQANYVLHIWAKKRLEKLGKAPSDVLIYRARLYRRLVFIFLAILEISCAITRNYFTAIFIPLALFVLCPFFVSIGAKIINYSLEHASTVLFKDKAGNVVSVSKAFPFTTRMGRYHDPNDLYAGRHMSHGLFMLLSGIMVYFVAYSPKFGMSFFFYFCPPLYLGSVLLGGFDRQLYEAAKVKRYVMREVNKGLGK